ncbi:efflux RND transporter periplasmic adaptor subunit [Leptolyngbya sp. NM3-A1]
MNSRRTGIICRASLVVLLLALTGCNLPKADAEPSSRNGQEQAQEEAAAVDVAIAQIGNVEESLEYTGTTQPFREVSLRSQIQAQLLDLAVDVGDRIQQGQSLARLDNTVQVATVAEAQAEAAALQAEVANVEAQVSDAQTQVTRAASELEQARSDLSRLQFLAQEGAIPIQQLEQARTNVDTAEATLRSTQQQVRSRQQQVVAAQQRVEAQRAVVAQGRAQQGFTVLSSPVTGSVLERSSEPGNIIQAGSEILRLGDFSQVKVAVQLSELELSTIQPGQSVEVRLDAFPEKTFSGRVDRISPAADPVARLIPVEVTIPNPGGQIGSGLLARVVFTQRTNRSRVVVPEIALQVNQDNRSQSSGGNQPEQSASNSTQANPSEKASGEGRNLPSDIGTIFVVTGSGDEATVTARSVTLGRQGDGQVEIISGLEEGDRYVVRSTRPLKNGDAIRFSVLSEQENPPEG